MIDFFQSTFAKPFNAQIHKTLHPYYVYTQTDSNNTACYPRCLKANSRTIIIYNGEGRLWCFVCVFIHKCVLCISVDKRWRISFNKNVCLVESESFDLNRCRFSTFANGVYRTTPIKGRLKCCWNTLFGKLRIVHT